MKIENIIHDPIAILRLFPENENDEKDLAETRKNLDRLLVTTATFITIEAHPRNVLSIIFKAKKKLP